MTPVQLLQPNNPRTLVKHGKHCLQAAAVVSVITYPVLLLALAKFIPTPIAWVIISSAWTFYVGYLISYTSNVMSRI